MYALIAGTGFDRFFKPLEEKKIKTPYGTVTVYTLKVKNKKIYYLPRHGIDHSLAPHLINYRANIWALKSLNVDHILSLCAVGSINENFKPGNFVLIRDILDFTKSRISTFYDGQEQELKHLDVSNLYSDFLGKNIEDFLKNKGQQVHQGIYVATEGPRFETAAEIKFYRQIGGDVVGMTGAPEVFLARELNLNYNSLALVTNLCTGIGHGPVDFVSSFDCYQDLLENLLDYLSELNVRNLPDTKFI